MREVMSLSLSTKITLLVKIYSRQIDRHQIVNLASVVIWTVAILLAICLIAYAMVAWPGW